MSQGHYQLHVNDLVSHNDVATASQARRAEPWLEKLRSPSGSAWALFLLLLGLAVITSSISLNHHIYWRSSSFVSPDCVISFGGGLVSAEGLFPHDASADCLQSLQQYSAPHGPYWKELDAVGQRAIAAFKNLTEGGSHEQVIVFDIDETALSNLQVRTRASASAAQRPIFSLLLSPFFAAARTAAQAPALVEVPHQ